MKIPPVKGTRDFYPEQMRIRNFIVDGWKAASLRNGFAEYDGPIFEYLKMFQIKSGDEIAEQLFSLTDRGGRELAIRPEITPTLARMVNQQINSLPRPIKWFSLPRLCRAERPQKGRLREFFQWNVDIIGVDDVLADAEVIFTAIDYLRQVGLTFDDIIVKISSRKMLAAVLEKIGVQQEKLDSLYAVLDKKSKLPPDTFGQMLNELLEDSKKSDEIIQLMQFENVQQIENKYGKLGVFTELTELMKFLDIMGVNEFCRFDVGIVRGLAYYTGIVFEIYDKASELRAIGGGGRYDNLLKMFGGPAITATGFGIGDCVLGILLEEKGLLQKQLSDRGVEYFVACVDDEFRQKVIELTAALRRKGIAADFSYKGGGLGKQLKQASSLKVAKCLIVSEEIKDNRLIIKDMADGSQVTKNVEEFLASL